MCQQGTIYQPMHCVIMRYGADNYYYACRMYDEAVIKKLEQVLVLRKRSYWMFSIKKCKKLGKRNGKYKRFDRM